MNPESVPGEVEFVSEPVEAAGGRDTAAMARGEPGLPRRFTWRGRSYEVAQVLRTWKEDGPCRHGSGERYLRKHWYRCRCTDGGVATLYFERQARSTRQTRRRWWLYTVERPPRGV